MSGAAVRHNAYMRHAALILLFALGASAQVSDGLTTNVNRAVAITPDVADFTVVVTTALDTTQQQVVQALQDLGVQNPAVAAVIAGGNNYAYPPITDSQFYYQVTFTTAPAAMKDLAKKLDALRATLPPGFSSVQYSAALNASPAAVAAAHDATLPKLLADAQAKAQTLASAAGLKLGGITGIAESFYPSTGISFPVAVISTGAYTSSTNSSNNGSQYTFSAVVKYAAQ